MRVLSNCSKEGQPAARISKHLKVPEVGPLTCLASVLAEEDDFFTVQRSTSVGAQDWVGVLARMYSSDRLRQRSAPPEDANAQQILKRIEGAIDDLLQDFAWKLAQTFVAINEAPTISYFNSRSASHRGFRGKSFSQRLAEKTQEFVDLLQESAGSRFKPVGSAAWAQSYVRELQTGQGIEEEEAARKIDESSGARGTAAGARGGDAGAAAQALRVAREHKRGRGPPTERGTVLIVERVDDVIAPLLHGATYGELVVDHALWTPGLPLVFEHRG